jgi:hypothetical protein
MAQYQERQMTKSNYFDPGQEFKIHFPHHKFQKRSGTHRTLAECMLRTLSQTVNLLHGVANQSSLDCN